jgi:hypothetical protein
VLYSYSFLTVATLAFVHKYHGFSSAGSPNKPGKWLRFLVSHDDKLLKQYDLFEDKLP